MKAKKGKKVVKKLAKGSIHLVNQATLGTGKLQTMCGLTACTVTTWARKTTPAADNETICKDCRRKPTSLEKAQAKGARRTEKIQKKHKAIAEAGERKALTPVESEAKIAERMKARIPKEKKQRGYALAILGAECPPMIYAKYKGQEYRAEVTPYGEIVMIDAPEGTRFNSPSLAAMAITGKPVNGWTFWKYEKSVAEARVPINLLRPEGERFIPKKKEQE